MDVTNISGQEIRNQNVKACSSIFEIIKTSLGPVSFDKMIINELGDLTFTNDGANILKRMEINHPAAKILVNLSFQQDDEIGDGTTSVVLIACELLRRANNLIKKKIHPSIIISAYRLAMCHSCSLIREKLCIPLKRINTKTLLNTARTSLSSKISGFNSKKFAILALQAVKSVQILEKKEEKKCCQIKAINFVKIHGNTINSSCLFEGSILEHQKSSVTMANLVSPAKIICLNFDLKILRPRIGLTIENPNPIEIKKIYNKEIESIKNFTRKIIQTGINLVFTTKGVDDFVIKHFIKYGIIAVRRMSDENLKKVAMVTGCKVQNTIQETRHLKYIDSIWVGEAEEIFEQEIAAVEFMLIRGCRLCPATSILLRGATKYLLDEIAQSLNDAIYILKKAIEGRKLITGGGATETSISVSLEKLASNIPTKEQIGILEFAEAILIIPKILTNNAGLNPAEILSKIKILHTASSIEKYFDYRFFGINLNTGKIQNHLQSGIIEPAISKIKCLQIATEAAITLLRIDDLIISKNNRE